MSVPAFLSSTYYYFERMGVSSVETILDDFKAQVLANSPVWTVVDNRPGTDSILCTSPVDGSGRFFDVLLTNVAAASNLKLECRVRDQNGVTVATRRAEATASNTWTVRIFTGQFHFCIDMELGSAIPSYVYGGILDLTPESQTAHTHYVYVNGTYTTGDVSSNNDWTFASMVDNVTAALAARCPNYASTLGSYSGRTMSGAYIWRPRMFYCQPTGGGNVKYAGRGYQSFLAETAACSLGGKISVPIDVNTVGNFRQIGSSIVTVGPASMAWYVRVP